MPDYFLHGFDQAAEIIAEVDAPPNLSLQFDAYHAQMITGDMLGQWEAHKHLVRHIQVGGYPGGRNEPIQGEIDYPAWFRQLDAEGYKASYPANTTPPPPRLNRGADLADGWVGMTQVRGGSPISGPTNTADR